MTDNAKKRKIKILDTTLRDGEQAPGCAMNPGGKIEVARKLEKMGVDIIEAGFPASGPADLASVKNIAAMIKNSVVAGLCRCMEADIDAARDALSKAVSPRVHLFLAVSPIHMEHKLKMSRENVLELAVASVKYAKKFCNDVQFSAEDAFRGDPEFVCEVFGAAIKAGALTVNFADTVGYAMPSEMGDRFRYVREHTSGIEKACLSAHCHNDLGLAVANSISAIASGADQVECTVNGIGERAGNASLEEIVMSVKTRSDYFSVDTRIDAAQIYSASRLVSRVTGVKIHANKAVVGDNAFAHEAGVHQHGVLARRETYEIMSPDSIGIPREKLNAQGGLILGRHSGRHAFEERLSELGIAVDERAFEKIFADFKDLAEKKKTVEDRDIEALVFDNTASVPETWKLDHWSVNTGSALGAYGVIRLLRNDGKSEKLVSMGDGPVDAIFRAINQIIGKEPELELYEIGSITGGSASQGETMVKLALNGRVYNGRGVSTDVIESSIKAYLSAVNAIEYELSMKS